MNWCRTPAAPPPSTPTTQWLPAPTYTYRIKAINGAGTSERSRWFHVDTPSAPAPEPPLTARIEAAPDDHNGTDAFTFRVAFSEDIGISFRSLREDAFTVSGGAGDAAAAGWTGGATCSR